MHIFGGKPSAFGLSSGKSCTGVRWLEDTDLLFMLLLEKRMSSHGTAYWVETMVGLEGREREGLFLDPLLVFITDPRLTSCHWLVRASVSVVLPLTVCFMRVHESSLQSSRGLSMYI